MAGGVANGFPGLPYSTQFYTSYGNTNGVSAQPSNPIPINLQYQQPHPQQQQKKSVWTEYKTSDGT